MLRNLVWMVLLSFCFIACGTSQTIPTSTQKLDLVMPFMGPLPPVSNIDVTTTGEWTASSSDTNIVGISPDHGSGNATLSAVPISWQPPGSYAATIQIKGTAGQTTIPVNLTVLPPTAPTLSYGTRNGPVGCTDVNGFLPIANAALCTVPYIVPPTAGDTYIDPNFGATVHVIAGTASTDALHGYSSPSPISATNKYALVSTANTSIVELLTGKLVRNIPIGFEGLMWDPINDNFIYTVGDNLIRRYDLTTGRFTTVQDYSKGALKFQKISTGGTGEITRDRWIAFSATQERQICAVDLDGSKTYCGDLPAGLTVDYPTMGKGIDKVTGLRYVIVVTGGGPFVVYSVNPDTGKLDIASRGPENVMMDGGNRDGICDPNEQCLGGGHSDTSEDSQGNQLLVLALEGQAPCEYSMFSLQLNKGDKMGIPSELGGGLKKLFTLFRCGGQDKWVDYHVGCAKVATSCVVSTTALPFGKSQDPSVPAPLSQTAHVGEIFVILDNGTEVRRLIQHRSMQFSNEDGSGYWSTPRAAISSDGAYVIADSNFGIPNRRRVLVIETRRQEVELNRRR